MIRTLILAAALLLPLAAIAQPCPVIPGHYGPYGHWIPRHCAAGPYSAPMYGYAPYPGSQR